MIKFPFLKRHRVEKKLKNIFKYPVTIICASSGYGKTTAVRNFLEEQWDVKTAWFTMPDNIIDETCLCKKFCLELVDDLLIDESKKRIQKSLMDINAEIEFIIEDIKNTVSKRIVLVIDDYKFNECKKFQQLIELISESNIPKFNIVIISCESPKLKFELDENCLILHQDFLNFGNEEIDELFKLNGIVLSNLEKEKVYNYSDGWGVAVYLSMINYLESKEINCRLSVEKIIINVILEQFSDEEKEILLKISYLDSFTRKQAIFITGSLRAATVISKLWEDGCFINYNKIERCYYLHHIFRKVLIEVAKQKNIDISEIEKLNGDWFLHNAQYIQAIEQYYKSEKYQYIYGVIESTNSIEYINSIPEIIKNLLMKIDDRQKLEHPIAYIGLICSFMFFIDNEKVKERLDEAKEFFLLNNIQDTEIIGEINLINSFSELNDFESFSESLAQTIEYFGNNTSKILNNKIPFNFGVPCILYMYHNQSGKMAELCEEFDGKIKEMIKLTNGCGAGAGYEIKAEYFIETGDYNKASDFARAAIAVAHCNKQVSVAICAKFLLARLHILEGDFTSAISILKKLEEDSLRAEAPNVINQIEMSIGFGYGIIGNEMDIPRWIIEYNISPIKAMLQGPQSSFIVFGIAMILNKDFSSLEEHAKMMGESLEKNSNLYRLLYSLIFNAISKNQLGRKGEALEDLNSALYLAEPDRMELPFIEMSPHFIDLLSEASFKNSFLESLIGRCLKFTYNYKSYHSKTKLGLLSSREEEVIGILSKGFKQLDICDELNISLPTVKTHIKNIYNKLGVNNKTEALKRWEKHKIDIN